MSKYVLLEKMTKFLGIILASIFSVILIVQIAQVRALAQSATDPITGPITSPITGPMTSPTDSPTPTLINTLTSTPILTGTVTPTVTLTSTPSVTVTPTPSVAPTPLPANAERFGGLNLDGYCNTVGKPGDVFGPSGVWYCGYGSAQINITAACQWQYGLNAFAYQDRANDVYSWSCYTNAASPTPSPTVTMTVTPTISETVTPTVTETVTPTPSMEVTPTVTESVILTPTPSTELTVTPTSTPSGNNHHFYADFPFRWARIKAFLNAMHFFSTTNQQVNTSSFEVCTNHDKA